MGKIPQRRQRMYENRYISEWPLRFIQTENSSKTMLRRPPPTPKAGAPSDTLESARVSTWRFAASHSQLLIAGPASATAGPARQRPGGCSTHQRDRRPVERSARGRRAAARSRPAAGAREPPPSTAAQGYGRCPLASPRSLAAPWGAGSAPAASTAPADVPRAATSSAPAKRGTRRRR